MTCPPYCSAWCLVKVEEQSGGRMGIAICHWVPCCWWGGWGVGGTGGSCGLLRGLNTPAAHCMHLSLGGLGCGLLS